MKIGIEINAHNHVMRERRKELGLKQSDLAERVGVRTSDISDIERLARPRANILKRLVGVLDSVADELGLSCDEMFPPEYMAVVESLTSGMRTQFVRDMSIDELRRTAEIYLDSGPDLAAEESDRRELIAMALSQLPEREREVIERHFGFQSPFADGRPETLKEIGSSMGVTSARIDQIEVMAIRRLRNPKTARRLRAYRLQYRGEE